MVVHVKTEHNIGDKVYIVYKRATNNDFYCTNSVWTVYKSEYSTEYTPNTIDRIEVVVKLGNIQVYYTLEETNEWVSELDVFKDLADALEEIEVRQRRSAL